jgi:hypothetical protein
MAVRYSSDALYPDTIKVVRTAVFDAEKSRTIGTAAVNSMTPDAAVY